MSGLDLYRVQMTRRRPELGADLVSQARAAALKALKRAGGAAAAGAGVQIKSIAIGLLIAGAVLGFLIGFLAGGGA